MGNLEAVVPTLDARGLDNLAWFDELIENAIDPIRGHKAFQCIAAHTPPDKFLTHTLLDKGEEDCLGGGLIRICSEIVEYLLRGAFQRLGGSTNLAVGFPRDAIAFAMIP